MSILCCAFLTVIAVHNVQPDSLNSTNEFHGFLPIRPDARMFYWLMLTSNETHGYESFPLVIALAGGPGDGSSGFTNFQEVGPFDLDGNARNDSWLRHANLLFLDMPVGSGYSFVDDSNSSVTSFTDLTETGMPVSKSKGFARNMSMIADDFVVAVKQILVKHPELTNMPAYIFGESYAARYAIAGAIEIHNEVSSGRMKFNLKGIALASPWVVAEETVKAWPDFMYALSFIDDEERDDLNRQVDLICQEIAKGRHAWAIHHVDQMFRSLAKLSHGFNPHHIFGQPFHSTKQDGLMNSVRMREKLAIPDSVTYASEDQKRGVTSNLVDDDTVSLAPEIEKILNETSIKLVVYNGQFDMITSMMGTERWINKLSWQGAEEFRRAKKTVLVRDDDDLPLVFRKSFGQLSLYFVLKAGHFVPMDQPFAARKLLLDVIG